MRWSQNMEQHSDHVDLLEKGQLTRSTGKKPKPTKPVYKLQSWMANLDDETPVSALSIPGTHDSAAYTTTWPFISTQNLDMKSQLYAGVRYFDFRCGIIKKNVEMVHGSAALDLRLSDVLSTVYTWLDTHPTEALIIQIKQDRKADDSEKPFADYMTEIIRKDIKYWRTHCSTPTLGELRGRIQLFRRYHGDGLIGFGVNVTRWQDNPEQPFTIHTYHGLQLTIQDHYSFSSPESLPNIVAKKGGDISAMLSLASNDPNPFHWYINFTSAFEFNVYYQINPRQIALGGYWVFRWVEGINIRLYGTLKCRDPGKKRYGVVVMDFPELPEQDLVKCIVDSNYPAPYRDPPDWKLRALALLLVLALILVFILLIIWPDDALEGIENLVLQLSSFLLSAPACLIMNRGCWAH